MSSGAKEWVQYASAVGMLVSGVVLTFICFFLNGYDITDGVLYYVAQCLVFAGAIYGVSIYVRGKVSEEVSKLKDELQKRLRGDGVDGGANSEEGDIHDRAAAG